MSLFSPCLRVLVAIAFFSVGNAVVAKNRSAVPHVVGSVQDQIIPTVKGPSSESTYCSSEEDAQPGFLHSHKMKYADAYEVVSAFRWLKFQTDIDFGILIDLDDNIVLIHGNLMTINGTITMLKIVDAVNGLIDFLTP
jgi:hypothetical protein